MITKFNPVTNGVGKVHLTTQTADSRYMSSLCGMLGTGRGYNFMVSFTDENGCKLCAKKAEKQTA